MRLLVVHHEAEVGQILADMVRDYTGHSAHYLPAASEVPEWLRAQGPRPLDLLITQMQGRGVHGLALRESLRAQLPMLQTIFLPNYPATEQRFDVATTHVFPEPIDGARLLETIAAAAEQTNQPEQCSIADFVQMCCLGKHTGALRVGSTGTAAILCFRNGQITHAETWKSRGEEALFDIVSLRFAELTWDQNATFGSTTITTHWADALVPAIQRYKNKRMTGPEAVKASAADSSAQAQPAQNEAPVPVQPAAPDQPDEPVAVVPLVAKPLRMPPAVADEMKGIGSFTGTEVGPYRVHKKLGDGIWGEVYEAEQIAMARPVALKILPRALHADAQKKEQFVADASAKANVHHPSVVAVYEAGEWNGSLFYARELIVGETLAGLQAAGQTLDEPRALQVVRAVAEMVTYLKQKRIHYRPIEPESIFVAKNGQPRLANRAIAREPEKRVSAQAEIQALGRALGPLVSPSAETAGRVVSLLAKMQAEGGNGIPSWAALLQQVKTIEPKNAANVPAKTADAEGSEAPAGDPRKKRRGLFWGLLLVVVALVLGG